MPLARVARRALIVAGVLCVLIGAAALALPRIFDLNRHRPLIAATIREITGREADLGTLSFALLPAPSITAGPVRIAEGPRYPGRQALTARRLDVRVGLLGLLRGRLEFHTILLDRPSLDVIRDDRGRFNFDDLIARFGAAGGAARGAGPAPPSGGPAITIDRAVIRHGRIRIFDDAVLPGGRAEAVLEPIDATLRGFGSPETRFDLAVTLGRSLLRGGGTLRAGGAPALAASVEGTSLRAADLITLLPWAGVARPRGLQMEGTLSLRGSASLPLDRPESVRFQGTLELQGLSYRDAGMTRPVRGLRGTLSVDGARASWSDFGVTIGSSSLTGKMTVEDYLKPRVGFTLSSPRLDFNEILGTFQASGQAASGGASTAAPPSADLGLIREVRGRGSLEVTSLRFLNFDLADVRASAALERGVLSLGEFGASGYGGTLRGTARFDLSRALPRHDIGLKLDGVAVEPLVAAYDPALRGLLKGTLAGDLDLTASGLDMAAILPSASGTGMLTIRRGSITSFSVLKQLAALIELAGGKGIGREETPFESLGAHLAISSARATTDDLALRSADLDLDGRGWIGLDATLDLGITARFSEAASGGMVARTARLKSLTDSSGRLVIPFALKGSLASPSFALDMRAQMKQVKEKGKESLLEGIRKRIEKRIGQEEEEPPPR